MKYEDTVNAVNRVIAQYDIPLTLRQIYYRLVAAGLIPNRRSAYNGLSAQLVTAREKREVDETRIVDRSRSIIDIAFDSPVAFLDAAIWTVQSRFLNRFWTSQPTYVEAWVEKDALSQVIAGAVEGLNTIVAPSRGYSSYSYISDALARFQRNRGKAKRVLVLHLGDHDPSGLDMTRDLRDRFNAYRQGAFFVEVRRVALTFDQVQEYNLIPNPTKVTDSRAGDYMARYGDECWELDAIEPDELVRLVQDTVENEIVNREAWDELKDQDQEERKRIDAQLEELKDELADDA
jgi:hypothetical protein